MKAVFGCILVALFIAGCMSGSKFGEFVGRDEVTLFFFVNETGQPLTGTVFMDGSYAGNASNGSITIERNRVGRAELVLTGRDATSGNDYTFRFELSDGDRRFDRINMEVPLKEYKRESFDATMLDFPEIERAVFKLANEERTKLGLPALRWNERIAKVARSYGAILPYEGFHHTDTAGRNVKARLSEADVIFFAASENLFFSGSMSDDSDLARASVVGWLESPGHRATLLDRDNIYSDAGVGVHCERRECYVVMNFAGMKQSQNVFLNQGWVTFHYLHNPGYNFGQYEIPLRLELSSSAPVNVYLVSGREKYEDFIAGDKPEILSEFESVARIDENILAGRGEGIIIESPNYDSSISFSIDFALP